MQDDALLSMLTVYENLWFSAMLRLPRSFTQKEVEARVESVITELGLQRAKDTRIGNSFSRGVSGGERRRVSIGMELVTHPSLLMLDEPTSGLDSKSSMHLVELLKGLVKRGRAITCTIHQPSSYIFSLFHRVCLLSRGNLIFFGESNEAITFFAKNGLKIPKNTNPADFFMENINFDFLSPEEGVEKSTKLVKSFEESEEYQQIQKSIQADLSKALHEEKSHNKSWDTEVPLYRTSFFHQCWYLLYRTGLAWMKNYSLLFGRLMAYVCMAFAMGTLYFRLPFAQKSIQDRISAITFSTAFLSFIPTSSLGLFLEEREIFIRERLNGYYSVLPYALSSTVIVHSFVSLCGLVYMGMLYYMVGFNSDTEAFWYFTSALIAFLWCSESLVCFISTLVPSVMAGLFSVSGFFGVFMLLNGFFLKASHIPSYFIWLHWIDFIKYTFEGIIFSEFSGEKYPCDVTTASYSVPISCIEPNTKSNLNFTYVIDMIHCNISNLTNATVNTNVTNATVNTNITNTTLNPSPLGDVLVNRSYCDCFFPDLNRDCILQGEEILSSLGYLGVNKWGWVAVVLGFTFFFRVLFYCSLRWVVTGRR
eukprot:TRINITY_DN6556_c0_g1_i1.p1 TRINITY_DN6556_c0_g1~~TRINITY_DN6556_c0_g1_i1.p1  ORF type:complete len:592 (-),score=86.96 TRINITY_DN6556_c0_g1_i1:97-1872(-)